MKLFSILMAVMMMLNLAPRVSAEEVQEAQEAQVEALGGLIAQVEEQGLLLQNEQLGEVYVNLSEQTVFEGLEREDLAEGQFVNVEYDGKMTRSLPPQISAQKVSMNEITGVVSEVGEDSITITRPEQGDQVIVHLPENAEKLYVGCYVTVYTNGAMTASLPGQVSAQHIVTPTLEGEVGEVREEGFTLTTAEGETYDVNMDETTIKNGELKTGAKVKVFYSGAATFSLPPQVFAIVLEIAA